MYSDWISPVRRSAVVARVGAALAVGSLVVTACLPAASGDVRSPRAGDVIQQPQAVTTDLAIAGRSPVHAIAGPMPFPFEKNVGQAAPGSDYLLHAGNVQVAFAPGGLQLGIAASA